VEPHWAGTAEPGFERLADAFAKLTARGPRGGALVVLRGDRVLVDVRSGWADPERTRPWERDTQAMGFSATKGLASMVVHRLADRGLIDYDEPVASYWPEFAANRKAEITVRQLLSHQAALFDVQAVARNGADLLDHVGMEERLAAAPTAWRPGPPPAYHALTFGWLASGLARAVSGNGMRELVRRELAEPLETTGLELGRPKHPAAQMVGNSLRLYSTLGNLTNPLLRRLPTAVAGFRALHAPGFERLCRGRYPAIWETEMPAVNGALSAEGVARLYAPLANGGRFGGEQFLSAETVDRLSQVQTRDVDRVLGVRMRWRLGFHQGFGLGGRAPRALGHYGFGGCGGWGDPESGLSFGFVSNHIGTLTTAVGDFGIIRLSGIAQTCAMQAL
jgi:CubicO group peptidase (beta-lactamase class C family)